MDKNLLSHFLTRKSLIVSIGFIILASIFFLILNTSQSPLPTPKTASSPSPTEEAIKNSWTSLPPDKQVEGQILVNFKPEYSDAQINERLQQYGASIKSEIGGINLKVVEVPVGQENVIIEKLRNDPYVETADGDYTSHALYTPNDTNFALQWGLNNTGQTVKNVVGTPNADINVDLAWDVTRGNGIKIAILDSGIATGHPEFAGKITAQKSFTTASVEDRFGHGTHVAGIAAAGTNNVQGIAGTCPDCQLIIAKVLGDDGTGETAGILSGITWAADQGAQVINLSLGTVEQKTQGPYQQAIDYAIQKGAIVVVAAGNCGDNNYRENSCTVKNQIAYPGANTGIITVTASDNKDVRATYSSHGSHVEVAAPGTNIYSTFPRGSYGYYSGSSMASPMVAGVVGLMRAANPNASSAEIINKLYTTADKTPGTGTFWTQGRVNAAKAVGAGPIAATTAPTPGSATPSYVCAGSPQGSVCPPTPTPGRPNVTVLPSAATGGGPNVTIGQPNTTPANGNNPAPKPGPQPCTTESGTGTFHNKKKVKNKGGFIEQFFKLFFQFIIELLKKLGITLPNPGQNPAPQPNPNPEDPGTNPQPCPKPTQEKPKPTNGPAATNAPAPTTKPAPTVAQPAPTTAVGGMPAITVSGNKILRGGQPWWFVGYNSFVWSGDCGDPEEKMSAAQVDAWFASMRHDGHGSVRLFFYSGWDMGRMDAVVASAKKHNIYLIITLDDAIGGCGENDKTDAWFNNASERSTFKAHMSNLLTKYKGETAIFAFEYFNEPSYRGGKLRKFYDEMGAHAATIDPNRLFSSGTVAPYWLDNEANFKDVSSSPGVDIASLHEYDQDEIESNHGPKVRANAAGKPVIAGEFGIDSNQSGSGCKTNFTERAKRFTSKAKVYIGGVDGYVGGYAWAWQPGNGGGTCEYGNIDADTPTQDAFRTVTK